MAPSINRESVNDRTECILCIDSIVYMDQYVYVYFLDILRLEKMKVLGWVFLVPGHLER